MDISSVGERDFVCHFSRLEKADANAESYDNPATKVTISSEGKFGAAMLALGKAYHTGEGAERFIFATLDGKMENAYDVATQLKNMIFAQNTDDTDLETRTIDREAAKKLAERIAENYLTDPKEVEAFLGLINKFAENSELQDIGPIHPPGPFERFLEEHGYKDSYKDMNYKAIFGDVKARDAVRKIWDEYNQEHDLFLFSSQKNHDPSKTLTPSWEEIKEMNCDPKHSKYSEQNKAWYAEYLKKAGTTQNIIDKAKKVATNAS